VSPTLLHQGLVGYLPLLNPQSFAKRGIEIGFHYKAQAGLELSLLATASQGLGLQVCITHPV
jgi:hypothetical protein